MKLPAYPHTASAGEVSSTAESGCLPGRSDFPEFTGKGREEQSIHSLHLPGTAELEFVFFFTTFEYLKPTHPGKLNKSKKKKTNKQTTN